MTVGTEMLETEAGRIPTESKPRFGSEDVVALLLLAASAGAVVFGILWARALAGEGFPSIDIYEYSHPIFVYAQAALEQGHGLLWNPLQNAGQPFFAIPSVALLYPANLIGLPFDAETWLVGQALFHLFVASTGSYALARLLGLPAASAMASAIAMLLGGLLIAFAAWSPLVLAAYAWMPWVLAMTERVLDRPAASTIVALSIVLTLQILAGYPQIVVFTYEIMALRLVWDLAIPRPDRWPALLAVAFGMVLPLGIAAVQLVPFLDVFQDSVRGLPIAKAARQVGLQSNAELFDSIWERTQVNSAFFVSVAGSALAVAAVAAREHRRMIFFYFAVGLLSIALVFDSPLLDTYEKLPVVGGLRGPGRFFWVTSFAVSVLVGFGAHTLSSRSSARVASCLVVIVVLSFAFLGRGPMRWWEWPIIGAALLPWAGGFRHRAIATLLLTCIALSLCLWMQNRAPVLAWLPDTTPLRRGASAFERIRQVDPSARVLTNERRRQLFPRFLNEKTPSLFGLSGVADYEHLTSRRYAELYLSMLGFPPLTSADQWIKGRTGRPRNRALLDLLGVRWIVTTGDYRPVDVGARPVPGEGPWYLFENVSALPRASFVPAAVVIENREERLAALRRPGFDPRRQIILERAPDDGFLGQPDATGSARFVKNESERLVIEVNASAAGYLMITDQYHPAWTAAVDGAETPILRADHALRAIHVPKGTSTVALRFRPWNVGVGAAISVATIASCAVWVWRSSRRRKPSRG